MALAEWGVKHVCASCHCRFYDLNRDPVICPKCATPFDPDILFKTRKGRSSQPVSEKVVPMRHKADFDTSALDLEDVPDLEEDLASSDDDVLLETIGEDEPLDDVIQETEKV